MRHRCNQVADPAACCPCAHGAPLNECDCTDFEKVIGNVPGADLSGYCRFLIHWTTDNPSKEIPIGSWEKCLSRFDGYSWRMKWNTQVQELDL